MSFKNYLEDNQQGISALGTLAGGAMTSLSSPSNSGMQTAGGAISGAAMGSVAGLPGMAVGAVVGGVIGAINAKKQREAEENAKDIARRTRMRLYSQNAKSAAYEFSNENIKSSSYVYDKGGFLPSSRNPYLVEGGEIVFTDDVPVLKSGKLKRLAENAYKFVGDKHSDPSGGILAVSAKTPFGGKSPFGRGYVFSNMQIDLKP